MFVVCGGCLDFFAFAVVAGLLIVALGIIGLWQRKIAIIQREEALADLYEAREYSSDRPIAQYPLIDTQVCIGCGSCVAACPEEGVLGLVNGVARVIHGARCIGHARCEAVCPVNAIKVGLGDTSHRSDIPVLTEQLETSVPGVYIAGELGGFALIRLATEQGAKAIDAIETSIRTSRTELPPTHDLYDILIVGAGPAGISASLRATQRQLKTLTIDREDVGGTVRKYPRRKLTLTGALTFPMYGKVKREEFVKEEFITFLENLIREYGLTIQNGIAFQGIEGQVGNFTVHTTAGTVRARRILLCLGKRGTPRRLGVPGEDQEKVLYSLVDAAGFQGEDVLVVGGGDSAIEAATALANQSGNTVWLSYRRKAFFRLKQRNRERIAEYAARKAVRVVFNSEVESIDADSVTLKVTEEAGEKQVQIKNSFVFVFAGGDPPFQMLKSMGVRFGGDGSAVSPQASQNVLVGR